MQPEIKPEALKRAMVGSKENAGVLNPYCFLIDSFLPTISAPHSILAASWSSSVGRVKHGVRTDHTGLADEGNDARHPTILCTVKGYEFKSPLGL